MVALTILCFAIPAEAALGRIRHGNAGAQRYQSIPSEQLGPIIDTTRAFTFTDKSTRVTLDHYPNGILDISGEPEGCVPPTIEGIGLRKGEECLHKAGTCEACDELRAMYDNGDVNVLYRASIASEDDIEGEIRLSIPIDARPSSLTLYTCKNGTLKSKDISPDSIRNEKALTKVEIYGNEEEVQSPFGIAYQMNPSYQSSNTKYHAYTPDDSTRAADNKLQWITMIINKILEVINQSE